MKIFKLFLIVCGLVFAVFWAQAQPNIFDIQFPISELGNCNSMEECKVFCDDSANQRACTDWARAKGFIKEDRHEPVISDEGGPGGCQNKTECKTYCDNPEHMDECLDFAVKDGFMTQEEADKIRQESKKTGPGGCTNRKECDAFCSNPDNFKTCIQFAVDEGMISQEDADFIIEREEMRMRGEEPGRPREEEKHRGPEEMVDESKIKELLSQGGFVGPGGCTTMDECDNYCSAAGNEQECFEFAVANGLVSEEHIEKFKKISTQGGPGGCRGQQECDAYCEQSEHHGECMQFAIDNEMMPPEEIERMKKMMEIEKSGGPGGCRGQQECDAYCRQPEHGEECFNFSKEHGLMSPEEIEKMEREMEIMRKMDRGEMQGPGGCTSKPECAEFCSRSENFEECARFSGEHGMGDSEEIERRMQKFKEMESMIMHLKERGDQGMESFMPMGGEMQVSGEVNVILIKKSSGMHDFVITNPGGIEQFKFIPTSGSPYSGGVSGCPKEFKSDTSFFAGAEYPIKAVIINCKNETTEIKIDAPDGRFGKEGEMPKMEGTDSTAPILDMFEKMIKPEGMSSEDFEKFKEMMPKDFEGQPTNGVEGQMPQGWSGQFVPMPMPSVEINCDFNNDGTIDENEHMDCQRKKEEMQNMEPVGGGYEGTTSSGNVCDFNGDGTVDEYEHKECANRTTTTDDGKFMVPMDDMREVIDQYKEYVPDEYKEQYDQLKEYIPETEDTHMPPSGYEESTSSGNVCDFNNDGMVDDYEHKECTSMTTSTDDGTYYHEETPTGTQDYYPTDSTMPTGSYMESQPTSDTDYMEPTPEDNSAYEEPVSVVEFMVGAVLSPLLMFFQ